MRRIHRRKAVNFLVSYKYAKDGGSGQGRMSIRVILDIGQSKVTPNFLDDMESFIRKKGEFDKVLITDYQYM